MARTNSPAETIAAKLAEVFAETNARLLADTQEWAKGRKAAITEFKSKATPAQTRDQWKYYGELFALAGGKTWFRVFNDNSAAGIAAFVEKNCAAIAAKRDATLAAKMVKAGCREIESIEIARTTDGFSGFFAFQTDAGRKVAKIQTIYAGGYNIQCAHLRVLCRVA